MVQGKWKCKKNGQLIQEARQEYIQAIRKLNITWKHVKGHSGDKWNDRADALADEGADMAQGVHTTRAEKEVPQDETGPLQESEACKEGGVRWVTYKPTETRRVLKSRTMHGCLNRSAMGKRNIPRGEITRLGREALALIEQEARRGAVRVGEATTAAEKVRVATSGMQKATKQREERKQRKTKLHTRELWCTMNLGPLDEIAKGQAEGSRGGTEGGEGRGEMLGAGWTQTIRDDAIELSKRIRRRKDGTGRVRIAYKYSDKGRDLYEAGHIVGSREYAVGADPFRWPEELRTRVMAGRGAEGDDASAFPRARRAMVPEDSSICDDMLEWKETILEKGGAFLFPGTDKHKRRKLMKGVINGFDMDSGLDAWRKKKEADTGKTLKGYEIRIGRDGEKVFSLEKYRKAQAQSTQWMADRSARMVEYLQSRAEKSTRSWRKAGLTTKSYLLQEAEATSRLAKAEWCREKGLEVTSLQHDGIMIGMETSRYEEASKGMSAAATKACNYKVEVVVKGIKEEWDLPPLRATQESGRGKGRELSTGGIPLPPKGAGTYNDESEDEDMNEMLNAAWGLGTNES